MSAAAAGAGAGAPVAAAGGANPFYEVTNLFSQKNRQGLVPSFQLGANTLDGGGEINPGNFLRGVRLVVATVTNGAGQVTQADGPYNLFKQAGVQNVDGAEILYNVIGGYAYDASVRYFRPWLRPAKARANFVYSATQIGFTQLLFPEVRQQLGCLENTDTRSQYSWTQTINTEAAVVGAATTSPVISVTPYSDMWAQPDAEDLEKTPNQQIPNGVNLQVKLRHQVFNAAAAGSDNFLLSTLTGNAVRGQVLIFRDGNGVRQDGLSSPIQWQLDQRNLSTFDPETLFEYAEDFYQGFNPNYARNTGEYPLPRFYNPGDMYGQGWLYTANSTAESWESSTAAGIAGNGTVELLQEEVYATGPVDPTLIDL